MSELIGVERLVPVQIEAFEAPPEEGEGRLCVPGTGRTGKVGERERAKGRERDASVYLEQGEQARWVVSGVEQ